MRSTVILALTLNLSGCVGVDDSKDQEPASRMVVPNYTEEGSLLRPEDFETWVFVGASIGLGYREEKEREGPGRIHNVQMQPEAYAHYATTGEFPEKTMFLLTLYEPRQNESIARKGFFSGDLLALEVALKDHDHFETGWAYFDFGKSKTAAEPLPKASCHDCHAEHGADDNVFVQFYPVLRRLHAGLD